MENRRGKVILLALDDLHDGEMHEINGESVCHVTRKKTRMIIGVLEVYN